MPQYRTTRNVAHSAEDMFDLVADVERYPEFVPLCAGMRVLRRGQNAAGNDVIDARMSVAYKVFSESFTSRVTLDRAALTILVEYLDGPFSHLENRWRFVPAGEQACRVEFFIDYTFRSRMLAMVVGSMFDAAFRRFAAAFEQRADAVYGRRRAAQATSVPPAAS